MSEKLFKKDSIVNQENSQVGTCPECGGPLRPYHEGPLRGHRLQWQRCDYCGYYVKERPLEEIIEEAKEVHHTVGNLGTAGLGFIFVGIFSLVVLAIVGVFSNPSGLWPKATVSKQASKAVNDASAFLSILLALVAMGFVLTIVGILNSAIHGGTERFKPLKDIGKDIWLGPQTEDDQDS